MKDPFKGEQPKAYKSGMTKMWKLREKLARLQGRGILTPEQERGARYAQDLLWEVMHGKGKRYDERDR